MSYNENAPEPDLDSWDLMVVAARQEWKAALDAYEDGLTGVEPPDWKEFWGQ